MLSDILYYIYTRTYHNKVCFPTKKAFFIQERLGFISFSPNNPVFRKLFLIWGVTSRCYRSIITEGKISKIYPFSFPLKATIGLSFGSLTFYETQLLVLNWNAHTSQKENLPSRESILLTQHLETLYNICMSGLRY